MIGSVNLSTCCSRVEIICPELSIKELKILVQFLYTGILSCANENFASEMCENLKKYFGFPTLLIDLKARLLKSDSIQKKKLSTNLVKKILGISKDFNKKHEDVKDEVQNSNDNFVSMYSD